MLTMCISGETTCRMIEPQMYIVHIYMYMYNVHVHVQVVAVRGHCKHAHVLIKQSLMGSNGVYMLRQTSPFRQNIILVSIMCMYCIHEMHMYTCMYCMYIHVHAYKMEYYIREQLCTCTCRWTLFLLIINYSKRTNTVV